MSNEAEGADMSEQTPTATAAEDAAWIRHLAEDVISIDRQEKYTLNAIADRIEQREKKPTPTAGLTFNQPPAEYDNFLRWMKEHCDEIMKGPLYLLTQIAVELHPNTRAWAEQQVDKVLKELRLGFAAVALSKGCVVNADHCPDWFKAIKELAAAMTPGEGDIPRGDCGVHRELLHDRDQRIQELEQTIRLLLAERKQRESEEYKFVRVEEASDTMRTVDKVYQREMKELQQRIQELEADKKYTEEQRKQWHDFWQYAAPRLAAARKLMERWRYPECNVVSRRKLLVETDAWLKGQPEAPTPPTGTLDIDLLGIEAARAVADLYGFGPNDESNIRVAITDTLNKNITKGRTPPLNAEKVAERCVEKLFHHMGTHVPSSRLAQELPGDDLKSRGGHTAPGWCQAAALDVIADEIRKEQGDE